MATLEIHDGQGRVEYLTIGRDQQVLLGSDPKCDIVIGDPAAVPFHARIRWRGSRYKIEATPDAQALEVDGKRVVSSSFRQGSELKIGKARVFLITPDDGPADPETTKVRPRPEAAGARGRGGDVGSPSVEDEFDEVEAALGSLAGGESGEGRDPNRPLPRKRGGAAKEAPKEAPRVPADADSKPEALLVWLRGLVSKIAGAGRRPGDERVLSSPLVILLVLSLAILLALGIGLFGIIHEMASSRAFAKAEESFENGEFRNAVERFDVFIEDYPNHRHVSEARVQGALAGVRQYTSGANPAWSNALDAAASMLDDLQQEPAFRDARADLAATVLEIAQGLVARASRTAEEATLLEAEKAADLHDRIGGDAAEAVRDRARFPAKLAEARAVVVEARVFAEALAAMDVALEARDSEATYEGRDALILRYPGRTDDPEVLQRLRAANDLIRSAVTVDPTRRPGQTEPRPDPLGPPTSLVLRSGLDPATEGPELVYAAADGFAYAIDASNGAPVWHVPVGLDCPFPPRAIAGSGGDALVVDARTDDLVRLDGMDGRVLWRQELGEPVVDPPLVLGNQIAQATPEGRLLLINVATGELQGSIDLGRPLSRSPAADELGRYYYVLGDEAVAFVVKRDPLECVAVEYIGHPRGSAGCPPTRLGNYLVIAENHRPESSRLSVFQLIEDNTRLRLRQRLGVDGWVWDAPASSGQILWAVGDRGSIDAYAVGPYEEPEPFKALARLGPEGARLGPTYAYARTSRELWVASGRSARYDLDVERGTVATAWTLAKAGAAASPPQIVGGQMILTQQADRGRGVALWSVDPRGGSVAWQTVLGAAWPTPPEATADGLALATLSGDGSPLLLSSESLAAGGFVQERLPSPVERRLPVGRLGRIDAGGATLVVPGSGADHLFVRDPTSAGGLARVELPSPLAASPMAWGEDLLVPAVDGRAYLVDPITGGPEADPLLSTFDRDTPIRWLDPVALDGGAVALAERDGVVRRLVIEDEDRPGLVASAEVALGQPLVAPPGSTGDTVILATADGWIRALASRDLGPAGAWELDAPLALGPFTDALTGTVIVADASGSVIAFGPGGERRWTIDLEGDTLAGSPTIREGDVWLLTLGGALHRRALIDGAAISRDALDPLPAGGPAPLADGLVVPVAPATLRPVIAASDGE